MAEKTLSFMQLNICGVSDHSQAVFNNYLNSHKPMICCLNETKKILDKNAFTNYYTEPTCNSPNIGGIALVIRNGMSYSRLTDLEATDFDNAWILTSIAGLKVVVGTAYLRHNETEQMASFLRQKEKVANFIAKHDLDGMLFMGDCNARHYYWGDSSCNKNGDMLVENISIDDIIVNDGEETFLASNGSSVIDLCIVTGSLAKKLDFQLTTDTETELFTGAPQRGHVPVFLTSQVPAQQTKCSSKPWLEKADWESWSRLLEERCDEIIARTLDADDLEIRWDNIMTTIDQATSRCIPLKVISRHSKPFWCQELTEKSSNLRKLRKRFKFCSNYTNGHKLEAAKQDFKDLLAEKASEWMQQKLSYLNNHRGKSFWQNYKRIFKPKVSDIGPLKKANGVLATTESEITDELRQTFFEGRHLQEQDFDEEHFAAVSDNVKNLGTEMDGVHHFDEEFTISELDKEIKNLPQSTSYDPDNIHVTMLKHFGPKMRQCLLNLFNDCYRSAIWPWKVSRVIFIKKPGKATYTSSSSYRPLTISSQVGKLFERMLNRRLKSFLERNLLIEEEQEGFREKRSSVRSLYRMQLEIEEILKTKTCAALLNIDLEKAFDSVWVDGLLVKLNQVGITGRMFNIIKSFLLSRESYIKVGNYNSPTFKIQTGLPQGSVLSPTLFILFINDFIGSLSPRFKFADDTSLLVKVSAPMALESTLQGIANEVQSWCRIWRMVVNGSKTEILVFNVGNCPQPAIVMNGNLCKVKSSTTSLGIQIDDKLNFLEQTEQSIAKAKRNWNLIACKCTRKYSLSIATQVFLYKAIILPQLLYGAPIWYHKNVEKLQKFQNSVLRSIFKHAPSPSIQASEALIGQPPVDILCESIAIKFAIKLKEKDDLVHFSHRSALSRPTSRASFLEASVKRFSRLRPNDTMLKYSPAEISSFITTRWQNRWNGAFNNCFLKNFQSSQPSNGKLSPLVYGDSYTANKLCEFFIGNTMKLSNYKWKLSQCESPLCKCKTTEETPYHFFFECSLHTNRPDCIEMKNVFNEDDVQDLKTFIYNTTNWTD